MQIDAIPVLLLFLNGILGLGAEPDESVASGAIDAAAKDDVQEEVSFLLRGMESAREQLASGAVKITGRREVVRPRQPEHNVDGPISGSVAFDFAANSHRYDYSFPMLTDYITVSALSPQDDVPNTTAEWKLVTRTINSVRNDEYFGWYEKIGRSDSNLMIQLPGSDWSPGIMGAFHIVDFRSLGVVDYLQFCDAEPVVGNRLEPEDGVHLAPLRAVVERFLSRKPLSIKHEGDIVTIEWKFETLVVNEREGYTPVSYTKSFEEIGVGVRLNSSTNWHEINGVWVPKAIMLEEVQSDGDKLSRVSYDLDWTNVNEPISETSFQYETFPDVEEGVYVIDERHGQPKVLGTWIDGKVVSPLNAVHPVQASSRWMIVGSLLLLTLLVFKLLRSRSRTTGSGSVRPPVEEA